MKLKEHLDFGAKCNCNMWLIILLAAAVEMITLGGTLIWPTDYASKDSNYKYFVFGLGIFFLVVFSIYMAKINKK